MATSWDQIFVDFSCEKLQQQTTRICTCLDMLQHEQIWLRGSQNENAVGNLVLHLCGNVRQWIGSGLGGRPDVRERDQEFAARGGIGPEELKEKLRSSVSEAIGILRGLSPEQLLLPTVVQSYKLTALQAVYHVVEHFSGHSGQIILLTKYFTRQDLGFYPHLKSPESQRNTDARPESKTAP